MYVCKNHKLLMHAHTCTDGRVRERETERERESESESESESERASERGCKIPLYNLNNPEQPNKQSSSLEPMPFGIVAFTNAS